MPNQYSVKHGMRNTRIYSIWKNMKQRCNNPNVRSYPRYGGRGITYDPKWEEFESFYEDMKEGYSDELSLDREDVNGNYCKQNCRWATAEQQQRNKRDNLMVTYKGEQRKFAELSAESGIPYDTLWERVFRYKWDLEKALTKGVRWNGK